MQPTVAWLGLDAHAKFSLLAWMDDQGQRRQHWRFPTSEPQLIKHLKLVPAAIKHLALEECGLGRWLAQVAAPHVTDAIVCDPRENYRISRHHHKCDEEDSYGLAHLHRLGALKKVWHSPSDARALFKCAAQAYLDAVQRQTALKLQLKAHYRQWGVIPAGSTVYGRSGRVKYLAQIKQGPAPTALRGAGRRAGSRGQSAPPDGATGRGLSRDRPPAHRARRRPYRRASVRRLHPGADAL